MLWSNQPNRTNTAKAFRPGSSWSRCITPKLQTITDLRSLIKSLNASGHYRYHLGIHKELARSTLSYANNYRSAEIFEKLFYALRNTLDRGIFIQ